MITVFGFSGMHSRPLKKEKICSEGAWGVICIRIVVITGGGMTAGALALHSHNHSFSHSFTHPPSHSLVRMIRDVQVSQLGKPRERHGTDGDQSTQST
jgi:hypothetical protein